MMWTAGSVDDYVSRWSLTPDGVGFSTASSHLLPVVHRGKPAMLKVARIEEEAGGSAVLASWNGVGAASVFEWDARAAVIERAVSGRDLSALTRSGDDAAAIGIICDTIAVLHGEGRAHAHPPLSTVSLRTWFGALEARAGGDARAGAGAGGDADADADADAFLRRAWSTADRLLAASDPARAVVLHGDLHHFNVLEFAPGDWRAIDPKSVHGDPVFDYMALFCNPDAETARDARLFAERVGIVHRRAGVSRTALLEWIVAWTGLSASWVLDDGGDARSGWAADVLAVGALADRALSEQALSEQALSERAFAERAAVAVPGSGG